MIKTKNQRIKELKRKEEIKQTAEKYFMQTAANNTHKYTLAQICNIIEEEFNVKHPTQTIHKWSKDKGLDDRSWMDNFALSTAIGVKQAEFSQAKQNKELSELTYTERLNLKREKEYNDLEEGVAGIRNIINSVINVINGNLKQAIDNAGSFEDVNPGDMRKIIPENTLRHLTTLEDSWYERLNTMRNEALTKVTDDYKKIMEMSDEELMSHVNPDEDW